MINPADVSCLIYERIWEISKILEKQEFLQRVEELSYINRVVLNHAQKLQEQEEK